MTSQNNKLIEVLKSRLSVMNRNKYIFSSKYNNPTQTFKLRPSKDYQDSKINTIRSRDRKQLLSEDSINLKIVPIIKNIKCVFKYENLNLNKKPEKRTYNGISTNFGLLPNKTYTKKVLFKSPYQKGKKNKNNLKRMVDFSKKFHSQKYKEIEINRDIVKTYSRNDNSRIKDNRKIYLKTDGNEKHIYKNIKLENNTGKIHKKHTYKYIISDYKKEPIFLRNIIKFQS